MDLSALLLAILLYNDVWVAYGLLDYTQRAFLDCTSSTNLDHGNKYTTPALLESAPAVAGTSSDFMAPTLTPTPSSPALAQKPKVDLETGVRIGIGISAGVFGIVILIASFEAFYLRKWRQKRAMRRAVAEVENGAAKDSRERIVLESRVSIVIEDEEQSDEAERGRNGMSLPRRVANRFTH